MSAVISALVTILLAKTLPNCKAYYNKIVSILSQKLVWSHANEMKFRVMQVYTNSGKVKFRPERNYAYGLSWMWTPVATDTETLIGALTMIDLTRESIIRDELEHRDKVGMQDKYTRVIESVESCNEVLDNPLIYDKDGNLYRSTSKHPIDFHNGTHKIQR